MELDAENFWVHSANHDFDDKKKFIKNIIFFMSKKIFPKNFSKTLDFFFGWENNFWKKLKSKIFEEKSQQISTFLKKMFEEKSRNFLKKKVFAKKIIFCQKMLFGKKNFDMKK